jgi:ATP-dependent helicase/nuclease subunit A
LKSVEIVSELLSEFKGMKVPSSEEFTHIAQGINKLRNFIKDHSTIFNDWQLCLKQSAENSWAGLFKIFQSLINYVEENYGRGARFLFSDLTFYTQKILYKDNIKSNIPYYIVVDELQDTSELQLEQIYLLAGKDAKNLYGVGDIKQAIYGFRGGQSHVFFEFENLVNNNRIELFDNYRSHSSIVAFNNQLFTKLFFKTKSFEQIAKSTYSDQEVSPVEILKWDISKEQKTTEWQQEILEFYALVEKIKKINNLYPNETIAVLFRTNSQIKKFSSLMCQENFSFQVQWKISFEEDPLFQVFNTLMLIGQARKNHQEMKSLEQLLRFYFSLVSSKNTIDAFTFFEEWKMFDAYNCFVRLLHQHQIINAYQAPFLETLKEKAAYSRNDFKAYLIWLDSIKNDELLAMWTLPFDASNKLPITLQTIHGSKGLQYDHVLLARISSQTKSGSKSDLIMGEANPYAIKELTFLKNPWKTPSYYYDEASKKKLAKEESNRLFYVACTRAKKTLTISLATNVTAESWGEQVLALGEKLGVLSKRSLDDRYLEIIQNEIRLLPVFESKIYQDWRGQFLKDSKTSSSLKLIPSLSVTSLVEYERCPLKYYFKNILTLDTEIVVTNNTPFAIKF